MFIRSNLPVYQPRLSKNVFTTVSRRPDNWLANKSSMPQDTFVPLYFSGSPPKMEAPQKAPEQLIKPEVPSLLHERPLSALSRVDPDDEPELTKPVSKAPMQSLVKPKSRIPRRSIPKEKTNPEV